MHSVRIALVDSMREDMATNPVALMVYLLKSDSKGMSMAKLGADQKLIVLRRLHGLYAGANAMMNQLDTPPPRLVWSIGNLLGMDGALGSIANAEVHRRTLLNLLRTSHRERFFGKTREWRARIAGLLIGVGFPELFTNIQDPADVASRWKCRIKELQSLVRPCRTSIILTPTPASWKTQSDPQILRHDETDRWDLGVRLAVTTALHAFRDSPAASTAFVDALYLPTRGNRTSHNIHAVTVAAFPRFVVASLTAEHIALMFQMDSSHTDPIEIWEMVELTLLLNLDSRQKVIYALSSWTNGFEREDSQQPHILDDNTLDEMVLEIAVRCHQGQDR
jgi:hypothetical protein